MGKEKKRNFLREDGVIILILFFILVLVFYSYFSKGVIYSIVEGDTNAVIEFINSFEVFAEIIFFLLVLAEVVLAPIPPLILYVAGGALFGTFKGGTIVLIGNILGAIICFEISRKFGRGYINKKFKGNLKSRFDDFSVKYGGWSIFLLRINPLTSSDIFSYFAGLSKMSRISFIAGTTLGLIPLIYLQSYLGDLLIKTSPLFYKLIIILSAIYLIIFLYIIFKSIKNRT